MKYLIPVLCAVVVLVGCAKDPKVEAPKVVVPKPAVEAPKVVVDWEKLKDRDDLWYFEEKPFTGVALKKHENGQKERETTFRDGKRDGLSIWWHKNGQKEEEATYKAGILMSATVWKLSGEKCPDTNLVDGTGIVCRYWENGQKRYESTFKDGKLISEKRWDEDGNPKWPPTLIIF